jgi:DnaJ-domain-containing protein 1
MDKDRSRAMDLRKKLRDRIEKLCFRVQESSLNALEHVIQERMDAYFTHEERLEEIEGLLVQMLAEVDQSDRMDELKKISERFTFLEDHLDEIESALFERPARRRAGKFNFFDFLRQWQSGAFSAGMPREIMSETEAYRELGLEVGASFRTVTAAFRRLAKELHPDQRDGDRSTEPKLRRLIEAYELIKKK